MKAAKVVKVGNHTLDLNKIKPITLGDLEKLEEMGIDTQKLDTLKVKDLITFIHFFANKTNPEITVDDVRSSPGGVTKIISEQLNAEPDEDFLVISTS